MNMVWLDWGILGVIALATIQGARVGAVERVIQIIAAIIALSECWRIAPWLRENVVSLLDINFNTSKLIALVLAFGVIYLSVLGIASWLTSFLKGGVAGVINRVVGAVFGLVLSIYAMGYAFTAIDRVGPSTQTLAKYELSDVRLRSKFYRPVKESIVDLEGLKRYLFFEEKKQPA